MTARAPSVVVLVAVVAFCATLLARSVVNAEAAEQREAVFARDGESADDARARLDACTSSEFGLCPPYEVTP